MMYKMPDICYHDSRFDVVEAFLPIFVDVDD